MQYIPIKTAQKDGGTVFVVNAISLKNKNKTVVQKIPHPMGTDELIFKTVEEAKDAIKRSGFSYILPDGKKEFQAKSAPHITKTNYQELIFNVIKNKIDSANSNVCASAISAISEFPCDETFEILFQKIGEENDLVRKNAIDGICRYGTTLQDRLVKALHDENWISRNSALACVKNLCDDENANFEIFIEPLLQLCEDANPIVQANALVILAKVYNKCQKK